MHELARVALIHVEDFGNQFWVIRAVARKQIKHLVNGQHLRAIALDVPVAEVRELFLAFSKVGALHAKNLRNGVEV